MTTPTQYVYSKQQFVSDVSLNGSTTMSSVNVTGNVGIGNTNPASNLHVRNETEIYPRFEASLNAVGQYSGIEFGIPAFTSLQRAKITSATETANASNLQFLTNPSGGTVAVARMTIDPSGNVGIGTTNPGNKLEIAGSGPDNSRIIINDTSVDTNCKKWGFGPYVGNLYGFIMNDDNTMPTNNSWLTVYRAANGASINSVTFPNGNVGIGTSVFGGTNTKVNIVGTNPVLGLQSGGGYDSQVGLQAYNTGMALGNLSGNNLNNTLFVNNNGNVGVGTTTPGAKLSVDYYGIGVGQTVFSVHTSNTGINDYNLIKAGHGTGTSFVVKGSGNVGIGTTNPTYPLHIASTVTNKNGPFANDLFTLINYSGLASGRADNTYPGTYETRNDMSFYTPNSICIDTYIYTKMLLAYSDNRIKNNIVDIDDEKALSILRQIKPKTYNYIDKLENGNANVIGFIAQEIKEILPKAVTIMKKHIPNFMTLCQVASTDVPNIVLVTSPVDLSWNPLHDQSGNAFIDAAGNACSDASGNKVFDVKLYDQSNNGIECKTTDVLDKRSFLMDISGSKMENVSGALQDGYFLHGQEVDDFHTLDKNAIFTVVTAAVQDIDRIVQAQAAKIIELENKNATLESQVASILAKLGM